jgi:uncharacterized protein (DUF486 family)
VEVVVEQVETEAQPLADFQLVALVEYIIRVRQRHIVQKMVGRVEELKVEQEVVRLLVVLLVGQEDKETQLALLAVLAAQFAHTQMVVVGQVALVEVEP